MNLVGKDGWRKDYGIIYCFHYIPGGPGYWNVVNGVSNEAAQFLIRVKNPTSDGDDASKVTTTKISFYWRLYMTLEIVLIVFLLGVLVGQWMVIVKLGKLIDLFLRQLFFLRAFAYRANSYLSESNGEIDIE